MREAKVGDKIKCSGVTATIKEIISQYSDPEYDNGKVKIEYLSVEFFDTEGKYRYWKQRFDGGQLISANNSLTKYGI